MINLTLLENLATTEQQREWLQETGRWSIAFLEQFRLTEDRFCQLLIQEILASSLLLRAYREKVRRGDWRAVAPLMHCAQRVKAIAGELESALYARGVEGSIRQGRMKQILRDASDVLHGRCYSWKKRSVPSDLPPILEAV